MNASGIEILVADDDALARTYLSAALRKFGYGVHAVQSGEAALELLHQSAYRFQAMVLDRSMGGINGMEVLRRIKKDPRMAALPVILHTASDQVEDVLEGMQAGAFYYLPKPVSAPILKNITKTAVEDFFRYREVQEKLLLCTRTLGLLEYGVFKLKTLEEADDLSHLLAQVCPTPSSAVLGISELLVNAIEHGNLEIDYDLKGQLLAEGCLQEEIGRRLKDPRLGERQVTVKVNKTADYFGIEIQDEGAGFNWKRYQTKELTPDRLLDTHGRGIFMANAMGFDVMEYRGCGNVVVLGISIDNI